MSDLPPDRSQPLDITAAVKEIMATASPATRLLIAQVFEIEKRYHGTSTTSKKLLTDLQKAVQVAIDKTESES